MPLSLNKPKLDNPAAEIWKSAERLRGKFKAYDYRYQPPTPTDELPAEFRRMGKEVKALLKGLAQ